MKASRLFALLFLLCSATCLVAQSGSSSGTPNSAQTLNNAPSDGAASSTRSKADAEEKANTTAAAAYAAQNRAQAHAPALLEHVTDSVLERFNVDTSTNNTTRYLVSAGFLVAAFLLRRLMTFLVFGIARRFASRTKTTLDDKLFPALEAPAGAFIIVIGIVGALKILKLSDMADNAVNYGSTLAFSLVVFWFLLKGFATILDHAEELARGRQSGMASFMPWIKKTLITVFVIFGVLMVAQSLGANVKAFLAGLGIGGLALALAAQDTIANLFGSVVVAIDQPFKIGDFVQIGANSGAVEDIGLRSTRLRRADKSLLVIPNKTVASEAIINLSRFTQRRVEQNISVTYDTSPEKIAALVEQIRSAILAEAEVEKPSVIVQFTDFTATGLNIWIVYQTISPDFGKQLALRERLNLQIMKAVSGRGLQFVVPAQTVQLTAAPAPLPPKATT